MWGCEERVGLVVARHVSRALLETSTARRSVHKLYRRTIACKFRSIYIGSDYITLYTSLLGGAKVGMYAIVNFPLKTVSAATGVTRTATTIGSNTGRLSVIVRVKTLGDKG